MILCLAEDVERRVREVGLHCLLHPVVNVDSVRGGRTEVLVVYPLHFLLQLCVRVCACVCVCVCVCVCT